MKNSLIFIFSTILILTTSSCYQKNIKTTIQSDDIYQTGTMQATNSGLQFQFLKIGDGELPSENDRVKCDYILRLEDGTEIDSSYKRGKPVVFGINQVIEGFKEALLFMPVGSKVNLIIPSRLAYGKEGVKPYIKPYSTLFYEVTFISIE